MGISHEEEYLCPEMYVSVLLKDLALKDNILFLLRRHLFNATVVVLQLQLKPKFLTTYM